jgi:hypothetical protein
VTPPRPTLLTPLAGHAATRCRACAKLVALAVAGGELRLARHDGAGGGVCEGSGEALGVVCVEQELSRAEAQGESDEQSND